MAPSRPGDLAIPADAPRRRFPALTAAFVTCLYAVAYLVWERNDWGTPVIRNLVSNVAFMPLNLAVVTLTVLASRSAVLDPGVRRALRLLGLGSAMVFIGNSISTWYLMVLHQNPPVSWADVFYLSDSILVLAALLSFPLARRTRLERWKFGIDAAMVLVGGAVVIWYYSIRPTAGATENSSIVITLLAFAYPLVSMLVLLGITTVILRRPTDGNRVAFGLIVGGVLISVVADLTFNLVSLETGGRSASIIDGAYLLCYVMLIAGAELYYRRPVPRSTAGATPRPRTQPVSPAALPRGGEHLRPAGPRRDQAVDRSGQRTRGRRAPGDPAGGGAAAAGRSGERPAAGRTRRCGRTRPGSARWCSTRRT